MSTPKPSLGANTVKAVVLTGYGINADRELEEAFCRAGAETRRVHLSDLFLEPQKLASTGTDILAFPGGFSFGDHLGSGKVLASLIRSRLKDALQGFIQDGGLVIGICNGFQVLVKSGFLPNLGGGCLPEVSLVHNTGGVFQDRWVPLEINRGNLSPWLCAAGPETAGVQSAGKNAAVGETERFSLPIRHGEGRLIVSDPSVLQEIRERNLTSLWYRGENPNGSIDAIAGLTDTTGRVIGMMPHPEAWLDSFNHPGYHAREDAVTISAPGTAAGQEGALEPGVIEDNPDRTGLSFFRHAVNFCARSMS
jgi:phosphoribosylformylglycinamidine synthase subunit PurQ / glutaminase